MSLFLHNPRRGLAVVLAVVGLAAGASATTLAPQAHAQMPDPHGCYHAGGAVNCPHPE